MGRWLLLFVAAAGCGHGIAERGATPPRETVLDDRERLAYIESVTRCVAEASGIDVTIEILDVASVAAYALPGERVALSRGLLAHLRSEAELEAVTAHELAHLSAGHVSAEEPEPFFDGSDFGALAEIVGAAELAAHSRAQEREADAKAVRYLAACGRSARAMVELFDVLERVDDDDESPWFATHPSFADRRHRLATHVDEVAPRDPGRAAYVEALAGLVYGEDPREGFIGDGDYVVPALDVRLALPQAWSSRITDGTLVSQSPNRSAVIVVERVDPGDGPARVQAALDAGGFAGVEIESYDLDAAHVIVAGIDLGTAGGLIIHLELEAAALVLFAISPRTDWEAFAGEMYRVIESFGRIEDPQLAAVQPRRIGVVRLDRPTTLASLVAARGSALDLAELAALNGVRPAAMLPVGTLLKLVDETRASSPPTPRKRGSEGGFERVVVRAR